MYIYPRYTKHSLQKCMEGKYSMTYWNKLTGLKFEVVQCCLRRPSFEVYS